MASIFRTKEYQSSTDAGAPLNGGYLEFLLTTTTTPKTAYPTEADAIAGTNGFTTRTLDADGRCPTEVWLTGRYRVRTYTSSGGTLIADDDPIEDVVNASDAQDNAPTYGGNNSGTATALVFTYSPALTAYTNGQVLRGRITASAVGPFTVNGGGGVKNLVDGAGNAITYLSGPNQLEFVYDSSTDVMRLTSGNNALMLGVHTVPVWASSMFSRTTNGAAAGFTELATNDVMLASKDFDQTTSEGVQFYVPMPKSWNEGTITAQFGWTAASGTGTVTWTIAGLALSDDDAMDAAFGTAQSVTDTLLTANDMHITSVTSAVTIAGTPAESDFVIFQITRDIADTLNADAKLIWCKVFVTLNAGSDA